MRTAGIFFALCSLPFAVLAEAPASEVEILNVPPYGYRAGPYGSGGGDAFDHYTNDISFYPSRLSINSGRVIDQICAEYTSTLNGNTIRKCNGRTGGDQRPDFRIDVDGGEFVNRINLAYATRLDGIQFHTNKNRSSQWYGGGSHLNNNTITMANDMMLYSFFGRAGREVDSLGFIIGPNCMDIDERIGEWRVVGSTNGNQAFGYSRGTTNSWSSETTTTFGETSTNSFSNSFEGLGSRSVTVTRETSQFVANLVRQDFSLTENSSYTTTFNSSGTVWQWQFFSSGKCGRSSTNSNHLMLTPNGAQQPCCLPTLFRDFQNPHSGGCLARPGGPVVNLC